MIYVPQDAWFNCLQVILRLASILTTVVGSITHDKDLLSRSHPREKLPRLSRPVALISLRILLTMNSQLPAFVNGARPRMSLLHRRVTYVRGSKARGHPAIRHTGDRLWQLILMAVENLRALIKLKEPNDSRRFLPSFLSSRCL